MTRITMTREDFAEFYYNHFGKKIVIGNCTDCSLRGYVREFRKKRIKVIWK
jgi:hypothetical protein